jgi:hypothetical protein
MLAVAITASAQDDIPVPVPGPASGTSPLFNQDPTIYDEKPLILEQSKIPVIDSLQHLKALPTPPAKQKSADPKKPQAEGDPLNFNFLYYIIQKFKASEVME